jgi:hypothetical protein
MEKTDNSIILGMDSTNHLLDWFAERGQKFMVIHIPTVLSMSQIDRAAFLLFLYDFHLRDSMPDLRPVDGHRREIQQLAFREYFLICLEDLRKFPIDLLDMFQRWVLKYRDQRQTTNLIEDECSCKKNKRCLTCEGTGKVLVFVEMNQIEALLAEGKTWDEVDRQLAENSKKNLPMQTR